MYTRSPQTVNGRLLALTTGLLLLLGAVAGAQDTTEQRIEALSQQVQSLQEQLQQQPTGDSSKLTIGGYGEIHANFTDGTGPRMSDIHRSVIYLGYRFNDWIRLQSETEIEHALVEAGNGYLIIEQLFLEFSGSERLNARAGRMLMPLGIINQRHEPTTFNGVERPLVDQVIIPSTWMEEGVGIYGNLSPALSYQAYLTNSLDGSKFTALEGMRKGRMNERPGLSQLAVSGRIDYLPLANANLRTPQNLRLGLSHFSGGVDNGNKGTESNIDAGVALTAADAEYSIGKFDLRGVYAYGKINGAASIGNNVASAIMGWYVEGAYHFWPDAWKRGKLADSDAVVFVRREHADTQYRMPTGVTKNPAGERDETTVGISFFPTDNVVLKADYQIADNASTTKPKNRFNLGIGWQF